jgi:hypothetical protein
MQQKLLCAVVRVCRASLHGDEQCMNKAGLDMGITASVCGLPKLPVLSREVRAPSLLEQYPRYVPHAGYNSTVHKRVEDNVVSTVAVGKCGAAGIVE